MYLKWQTNYQLFNKRLLRKIIFLSYLKIDKLRPLYTSILDICKSKYKNRVFAPNLNFLIPISLQPNYVNVCDISNLGYLI